MNRSSAESSLREYARKRDFSLTPEPRGAPAPAGGRSFVVQKHAASRLHYDFRLEMDGVLKSWAVPKGPSLDPADRRLAMQTEDHPVEYGGFEGVIPEGEYGGGTVVVWDRGTWEPLGDPDEGLRRGVLKFALHGEKLRGRFALVRIKGRDGSTWLLIKDRDEAARRSSRIVETSPNSVASGRTLEEVAADQSSVWHSNREGNRAKPKTSKPAAAPKRAVPAAAADRAVPRPASVPGARRAALSAFVRPQLATLVSAPPEGEEWLHEMKFDGYRLLLRLHRGRARLLSREAHDWTARLPAIADAASELHVRQALLDGEAAVLLPDGTTSFEALQNVAILSHDQELVYFAFDLLHLDGYDLRKAPLEDRKRLLRAVLGPGPGRLRYSDHVLGSGPEFFERACEKGLEGIVSKRRDAAYTAGRSRDWLKVKCLAEQEFVIGGYTPPERSRVGLGALLLGVYDGEERLRYAGKVGTGFTHEILRQLEERLRRLKSATSPFADRVPAAARAFWVRPELVAQVAFTEWTKDGRLRHPSFRGLREDKPAREVIRESPQNAPKGRQTAVRKTKEDAPRGAKADESVVAGVRLTHPDRVLYPRQGVTKRDLALFYESIADCILPHLEGRPTSLVRCPEGLGKECFYQKHATKGEAEGLRRVKIRERTKVAEYLVVDDLKGLIALVQMGILEIHTWNSHAQALERPDRVVFDLDPGPGVEWPAVVEGARRVKARLEAEGLKSFVKTTGGKGLHVVTPLDPAPGWDEASAFAREVAESLAREEPRSYVAEMSKARRQGRIFVDYLRNYRGATSVAAYSTRARPGAPVSVPVRWDELGPALRPDAWTVENLGARLKTIEDPWRDYWKTRQALPGGKRKR